MIGWLIFAVWLVGFLWCWRVAAWIFAHHGVYSGEPDGDDIVDGLLFGAFVSVFWPIVVPGRIAYTHGLFSASRAHALLRPPKAEREKALREERDEQTARIAELEEQLGIGK